MTLRILIRQSFKQYGLGEGKYQKNYENIYEMLEMYNGVNTAIKNAKRRMAGFDEKRCERRRMPVST